MTQSKTPITQTSNHPRTDEFENSCATVAALRFKNKSGEKANFMEIEFVMSLEHARQLELELQQANEKLAAREAEVERLRGLLGYNDKHADDCQCTLCTEDYPV